MPTVHAPAESSSPGRNMLVSRGLAPHSGAIRRGRGRISCGDSSTWDLRGATESRAQGPPSDKQYGPESEEQMDHAGLWTGDKGQYGPSREGDYGNQERR